MSVGFLIGDRYWEIGASSFLHAFFSTISYYLETDGWGTRYPELMNELYQGKLEGSQAGKVVADLHEVQERLRDLPAASIVWDIDNPSTRPPWGDTVHPTVTDLAHYFMTSNGRDLFDVLFECLRLLKEEGGCLRIVPY